MRRLARLGRTALVASAAAIVTATALAQPGDQGGPPAPAAYADERHSLTQDSNEQDRIDQLTGARRLSHAPVTGLFPGGWLPRAEMSNPMSGDVGSVRRGMQYFVQFNCVGCHAPNGGGGMGPSLSNAKFIYGAAPADVFLSIVQGRPKGMPAWGRMLPDNVVWDLVSYIESISRDPDESWGRTTSREALDIEQVPAEYLSAPDPWRFTMPFSSGRPPLEKIPERLK